MEERGAAASVAVWNLDAHHAEAEELVNQRPRNLGVVVHFSHERPDFAIREFVDAGLEQPFVFGQGGQRARDELGILDGHSENLITRTGQVRTAGARSKVRRTLRTTASKA